MVALVYDTLETDNKTPEYSVHTKIVWEKLPLWATKGWNVRNGDRAQNSVGKFGWEREEK